MFFAILVLLSAFLIEGIGTYVSVVGLSSLFAANPVIIVLAIALDVGKVVSVSFLYKYWKKVNLLMKTYMTIAAIVLMGITSAGAFGYLSAQFQKAIANTNESGVLISSLTDEQGRLQKRKEEIDAQVAKLPDNMVRGRTALIKQFGPEVERINTRLVEIDKQLPTLKIATLHQNVEVGPIIYIAEAFGTTPEHAVKWVILIIIFVFDPLAIALLLAGNFLIEEKDEKSEETVNEIELPYVKTDEGGEKVDHYVPPIPELPKIDEDTPHVVPASEAIVRPNPYFIPSPTQAITSWTTTTEYVPEEEPTFSEPELPVAEPVAEEPVVEPTIEAPPEEVREVIKLDQLIKHPEPKVYRSSLEDIGTISDIEADLDPRRNLQVLRKTYTDPGAAVTVGGPF
jgi:hypothetical protein